MKPYTSEEIECLIARFEARTLPKEEWTHQAHLVVAIWYCCHYDFQEALNLVRDKITKYNESVGTENTDTSGYHETITKFWLIVAAGFIRMHDKKAIEKVCKAFIESKFGNRTYPMEFYSKGRLFSVKARHFWVESDIRPLIIDE